MTSRPWSSPFPRLGPPPSGVGDLGARCKAGLGRSGFAGRRRGAPAAWELKTESQVAVVRSPSDPRPDAPGRSYGPAMAVTMADRRRTSRPAPLARLGVHGRSWCKENVPSPFSTQHEDRQLHPTFMNTKRWVFVKKGLDDFRNGCPSWENMITRGLPEHPGPQRYSRGPRPPPRRRPSYLPEGAALCSRLSAAQRARKAFLEDIEAQLTRHTLAPCPGLEESLPPELLKRVLEVLDPDKKLEDAWAHCEGVEKKPTEPTKLRGKCPTQDPKEPTKLLAKRPTRASLELPKKTLLSKNSRQSLSKEKKPRRLPSEEKTSEKDSLHKDGPDPYENAHKSVRDLCDWAASIGSTRIDEEYIMKQFEVNYEREVSHNVLHSLKLGEIPGDLKKGEGLKKQQESEFFQELEPEPKNTCKPKHVKMRYGAWYLHPKLWKRQRADEPLTDPKALHKDENLRKEQKKQEEEFAKLHGPAAFRNFILRKGYRMPSFLENINTKKECKCDCNKTPGK
ncbi:protein FAM47E isoform X2 [Pipistrellus kuhlii]|uniref:protein FAM47E isoform X2 n=1 Tax=Pipistrellus kuhlii TaxID=59472 RepID=UPI001E26F335|nr:protein FAM47E isoform X2 [Pipistrellus kuhlii]